MTYMLPSRVVIGQAPERGNSETNLTRMLSLKLNGPDDERAINIHYDGEDSQGLEKELVDDYDYWDSMDGSFDEDLYGMLRIQLENLVDFMYFYMVRHEGQLGFFLMASGKIFDLWICLQYIIDFEWSENFGYAQQQQTWGWTLYLFGIVFTAGYLCRVIGHYGYPSISSYTLSWMGLVDLVVLVAIWGDIILQLINKQIGIKDIKQITRVMRLFRSCIILKLDLVIESIGFFSEMTKVIASMFTFIFLTTGLFLCFGDLRESFIDPYENVFGNTNVIGWFNAFYFSSTTVLTVGYGDIAPKTVLARMVCTAVQLLAYGLMAYNITRLLDSFTEAHRVQRENDLLDIVQSLKMNKFEGEDFNASGPKHGNAQSDDDAKESMYLEKDAEEGSDYSCSDACCTEYETRYAPSHAPSCVGELEIECTHLDCNTDNTCCDLLPLESGSHEYSRNFLPETSSSDIGYDSEETMKTPSLDNC